MTTFDILHNRYTIRCKLRSRADLHIGSGREGEASDAGFIMRDGRPFIPGSSLRGMLRSEVERILRALFPTQQRVSCVLFSEEDMSAAVCMAGNEATRRQIDRGGGPAPADYVLCPVCRLFGSTIMAGRLKVTDALQAPPDLRGVEIRDGVGIDRDTGSAKEGIKYNFDVMHPGALFEFSLIGENLESDEFALLHILLTELKRGLHAGGKKGRGLGMVVLEQYEANCLRRDQLLEFYETGKEQDLSQAQLDELTVSEFQAFVNRMNSPAT